MSLAVFDGDVDQLGIFGFLGGGEDERRVGGSILRLVFSDGSEVPGVTDNSLYKKLVD